MKYLVIVESPTKARTIGKFLGKDYVIKASMGHIVDLPKSPMSIDIEHDFAPQYEIVADKKKIIADLKSAAKDASTIILATDPDREGEAIASHVKDVISSNSKFAPRVNASKVQSSKFQRIAFHEITKEAIEEALKNPRDIDEDLVEAQTARRVLDRLVGYKLSPLLWQKVRRGLSAGRVQSVALRLIVEREREIEKFGKEEYWTVTILLSKNSVNTEFELIEVNGERIESQTKFDLYDGEYKVTKTNIDKEEKAKEIVEDLKTKQFQVADVLQKEMRRLPQPPFTTSTLQQQAAFRLGFTAKRTMSVAQKLYEEGYITYHRTDSVVLSSSAIFALRGYVEKEFGKNYIPEKPRFYKTKQKSAQEAHEAIRPTKVQNSEAIIKSELGPDYAKLYELIWKRALASQMADAVIESTTVYVDSQIQSEGNSYRFKANGSVLVFDGFLKINPQALEDKRLPQFINGENLSLIDTKHESHETTTPPRYNDASLIKTLEEKGIGRPSTYASIISTIEERKYIDRVDKKLLPTSIGMAVNDFLVKNFSTIDDLPFTAEMENMLDEIAEGKKKWAKEIKIFYKPFSEQLEKVKGAERVKIQVEETNEICPKCNSPLVVRHGRFGKFLSCSRFPDCDFKKSLVEQTNLTCPKDGGKVIVKKTKRGRKFYGCSNYPKCDFAAWKLEDIKNVSKELS